MPLLGLLLLVPGQIDSSRSDDFSPERQFIAITSAVQIVNVTRSTKGSGAIIRQSGPFVYILTAAHVLEGGKRFEIHTFSSASYPRATKVYSDPEVLARTLDDDLALLRLTTSDPVP